MAGHQSSKPFALPVVGDEDAELSRLMIGGEHQLRESNDLVGSPTVDLGDDTELTSGIDLTMVGDPLRGKFERVSEPLMERCAGATSEHVEDKGLIFFLKGPQHHDHTVVELGGPFKHGSIDEWTRLSICVSAHQCFRPCPTSPQRHPANGEAPLRVFREDLYSEGWLLLGPCH